jgi:hypothetical protein
MAPPPLATPAQLGNFLQQTIDPADPVALQLLAQASALIRRYMDMTVTAVAGDVERCSPVGNSVFLKEAPITAISQLELLDPWAGTWTTVQTTDYDYDLDTGEVYRGYVNNTGVRWPTDRRSWRVTYDHGFATVPDDIAGVCYGVAARFYTTPAGIDSERTGQRQVKYDLRNDDFTALERMILDGYRHMRVR